MKKDNMQLAIELVERNRMLEARDAINEIRLERFSDEDLNAWHDLLDYMRFLAFDEMERRKEKAAVPPTAQE